MYNKTFIVLLYNKCKFNKDVRKKEYICRLRTLNRIL